ncbi:hypothetical protein J2754_000330 [Halarchaeum solikamskense]|uniref:hypothetical protein n=1 Tax=Halarchaeum nitratireducens TaxID=489913 RepID=UPI001B3ABB2D|nr:hypothetical protein [Halarchaeum solikamskense]MBP2250033.1 hypothetical protein [Halarchaeum solikamskense]
MPALHRSPPIVGVAAAVLVGGVVHYWFADPALSVAVGLLYFAIGYFRVRYGRIDTSLRGLGWRATVVGFLGLLGVSLVLVESGRQFGLGDLETYLFVLVLFGASLFFATVAAVQDA